MTDIATKMEPQAGMTSWDDASVEGLSLDQLRASAKDLTDGPYPRRAELEDSPCDLVMKGGITSGVVYPLAACQLAKQYRFHNIGGASAGAIGAVMIAAAEHGRDQRGFEQLAEIPTGLGPHLGKVFTPTAETDTAYRVLMAALTPARQPDDDTQDPPKPTTPTVARRVLAILVRAEPLRIAVALVVAAVIGVLGVLVAAGLPHSTGDWIRLVVVAGLWTVLIGGAAAFLWAAVRTGTTALHGMEHHGFGVCVGSDGPTPVDRGADHPGPFTDWMHEQIQLISGTTGRIDADGTSHPLTFADLQKVDINLQVMTTNLTLGRPQSFPFVQEQGAPRYLFDPAELADYFPPDVLEWLVARAPEDPIPQTESVVDPHDEHRARLRWLPASEQLPVLIAARLSLSFPGLISAVPLWVLDKDTVAHRCWMTDGGLTANFPVHFFDSPLPGCPTFAIDLQRSPATPTVAKDDVYYPAGECDATPSFRDIRSMTSFGSALLTTMQYWSDTAQAALPGYRDRIVQVRLTDTEGGMNLQMPELRVLRVALKGSRGAIRIAGVPGNDQLPAGFDLERHQWTRYLSLMARLQWMVGKMPERWHDAASPGATHGYEALVRAAAAPSAPPGCERFERGPEWRTSAIERTNRILTFVEPTAAGIDALDFDGDPDPPTPRPDLRMTPHI